MAAWIFGVEKFFDILLFFQLEKNKNAIKVTDLTIKLPWMDLAANWFGKFKKKTRFFVFCTILGLTKSENAPGVYTSDTPVKTIVIQKKNIEWFFYW